MATEGEDKIDVATAIKRAQSGNRGEFDEILNKMTPKTKESEVADLLRQCKDCSLLLGKDFISDIGTIMNYKWLDKGDELREEFKGFVLALVSADTMYLKNALRMIVKQFLPPFAPDSVKVDAATRELREKEFSELHTLLRAIIKMVPMAPLLLLPLLSEHFPFMNKSAYGHECYMRNMLAITRYLPQHRNGILIILIDRMAKLDVRAPRQEILLEDDNTNEQDNSAVFDMEDLGEEGEKVNPDEIVKQQDTPMSHDVADRLDVMMNVFLQYIHSVCYPNGTLDWEATKNLYRELLQDFDQVILTSHALHHTQFFMFYICSFREELTLGFIDYLWKKVYSPATQITFRQTAVCYIGSLLARAKYACIGVVTSTLDVLMDWLHKYAQHAHFTGSKAELRCHGTFYAVLQSVLYVLVFRHREIIANENGLKYIRKMNLQTLVTCRLNPLKFCLPIIAKTFASVMRQHQLLFCDTILERNRRKGLSVEGDDPRRAVNPLDSFFPFDPYVLKRSSKHFTDLYREYEGTPAAEDEEDDAQNDEEMEEEIFSATPGSTTLSPSLTPDFMMYGTSPGFKNL